MNGICNIHLLKPGYILAKRFVRQTQDHPWMECGVSVLNVTGEVPFIRIAYAADFRGDILDVRNGPFVKVYCTTEEVKYEPVVDQEGKVTKVLDSTRWNAIGAGIVHEIKTPGWYWSISNIGPVRDRVPTVISITGSYPMFAVTQYFLGKESCQVTKQPPSSYDRVMPIDFLNETNALPL